MKSPEVYGVYLASFPFLENKLNKLRPVIVVSAVSGTYNTMTVLPVTSRLNNGNADLAIMDWAECGLLKPSAVKVTRITTILQSDLTARLGMLSAKDMTSLKLAIKEYLQL